MILHCRRTKIQRVNINVYLVLGTLVVIDNNFTSAKLVYNLKQKLNAQTRQLTMNPKISDMSKKINFTKMIFDKTQKCTLIIVCTDKKVFVQEQDEPKTMRVIFEMNDSLSSITGIFEGNNQNQSKLTGISIIVNYCIIIELDVNKTELISELIISNYLYKQKTDSRMKCLKFEENGGFVYSILINNDESKNPRSIWKFQEKILLLKFRPKTKALLNSPHARENHMAICFDKGLLKIFHYESRAVVRSFKTNYGNITSLEYSVDGKLIGLGCDDDNSYIIDAEYNELLNVLEGHKNTVTSVVFEEQIIQDDEIIPEKTVGSSNYETNKSDYNSVQYTSNKIPVTSKCVSIEDFASMSLNDQESSIDVKQLRRMRTSTGTHVLNHGKILQLESVSSSTIYDVFTAGLDGQLGIWRIELFEEGIINESNFYNIILTKESMQLVKLENPPVVPLNSTEDKKVFYTNLIKISNGPLNQIMMVDNMFISLSKRCNAGSSVNLRYFHGIPRSHDDPNPSNFSSELENSPEKKKGNNLDTRYEMLKQTSVNIKGNVMNENSQVDKVNTPKRERGSSSSPTKKHHNLMPGKTENVENLSVYTQSTTSPDKRVRGHSAIRR